MGSNEQRLTPPKRPISRRRFLGVAASVAGGAWLRPAGTYSSEGRLQVPAGQPQSRVVQVRAPKLVNGPVVHRTLLEETLHVALTALTGKATTTDAWHTILKSDDVIGLKFNRSGQRVIGTTNTMASVAIASLVEAGWRPDQIVCIETPAEVAARHGTAPPDPGFALASTDFESGSDQLALVLGQVSALIDIPYLKTHNIAGVTCCLKNLSHGLIKHPARYHRNRCAPYVGDIVALPQIRGKLRLCLVDAMRVVYAGGPEATAHNISDEGVILASADPVATDTIGLALISDVRRRASLPRISRAGENLGYLEAAHRRGLGMAVPHGIDLLRVEL